MDKITYGIVKEEHMCGDTRRISYGIAAYSNIETDGSATILEVINDISSDEQSIIDFVEKCNMLKLSLCHLKDTVEDFVTYN